MSKYKFGRKPRTFNPDIPHFSDLKEGAPAVVVPASVDYTKGMAANFGMMLNDQLGDCTIAAFYHAIQIWTFVAQGHETTYPDNDVLKLYEKACGYNPRHPKTDQGGNEQDVLTYILKYGAPTSGFATDKIAAFVEVDHTNIDDVKEIIYECGVAYIGFDVPQYIVPDDGDPPAVWDVDPTGDNTIVGGHAVVLTGFDANNFTLISWGQKYQMTPAFFLKFVDEVYGIADRNWVEKTGLTPAQLNLAQLEQEMQALRGT